MLWCECVQKYRDKDNNIVGYKLKDDLGKTIDVSPLMLKEAIKDKRIMVSNLKLTFNDRLIDTKPKKTVYLLSLYNMKNAKVMGVKSRKDLDYKLAKAKVMNYDILNNTEDFIVVGDTSSNDIFFFYDESKNKIYKNADEVIDFVKTDCGYSVNFSNVIEKHLDLELFEHPFNENGHIQDFVLKNDKETNEFFSKSFKAYTGTAFEFKENNLYDSLVRYNWRLCKAFIPVFNYLNKTRDFEHRDFTEKDFMRVLTTYSSRVEAICQATDRYIEFNSC